MNTYILDKVSDQQNYIWYDEEKIFYSVKEKRSSKRTISIKVTSSLEVEVTAPVDVDQLQIKEAVNKRARWIFKQLSVFKQHTEYFLPKCFVSGESHRYLGKNYQLKIYESDVNTVKLVRGKIEIYTCVKESSFISHLLFNWYVERAKQVFERRLKLVIEQALWVNNIPPFKVHKMDKQWGSCTPQGTIILNPHLIKAPTQCVDYVILHELCHLVEHNHSEKFYRLLTQVMPDWQLIKNRLDDLAAEIIY